MKFEIGTYYIRIIPENGQDFAYLRDTLGVQEGGHPLPVVKRVNTHGTAALARLEICKAPAEDAEESGT